MPENPWSTALGGLGGLAGPYGSMMGGGIGGAIDAPSGYAPWGGLGGAGGGMVGSLGGGVAGGLGGAGIGGLLGYLTNDDAGAGAARGALVGALLGSALGGGAGAEWGAGEGVEDRQSQEHWRTAVKGMADRGGAEPTRPGMVSRSKSKDDEDTNSGDRDKTSSYKEKPMSMQKVAAGYGAIARLNQEGIDPARFVKVAAQSRDPELHVLADCILAAARDNVQTKTAAGWLPPGASRGVGDKLEQLLMKGRLQGGEMLGQLGEGAQGLMGDVGDLPGNIADYLGARGMRNEAMGDVGAAMDLGRTAGGSPAMGASEAQGLMDLAGEAGGEMEGLGGSIGRGLGTLGAGVGLGGLGAYGAYEGLREPTWQEKLQDMLGMG